MADTPVIYTTNVQEREKLLKVKETQGCSCPERCGCPEKFLFAFACLNIVEAFAGWITINAPPHGPADDLFIPMFNLYLEFSTFFFFPTVQHDANPNLLWVGFPVFLLQGLGCLGAALLLMYANIRWARIVFVILFGATLGLVVGAVGITVGQPVYQVFVPLIFLGSLVMACYLVKSDLYGLLLSLFVNLMVVSLIIWFYTVQYMQTTPGNYTSSIFAMYIIFSFFIFLFNLFDYANLRRYSDGQLLLLLQTINFFVFTNIIAFLMFVQVWQYPAIILTPLCKPSVPP